MFTSLRIFLVTLCIAAASGSKKVKLEDLQVLTLHADRETEARRANPIPQLECVGGSAGCPRSALPRVVQCTNAGYDGVSVNWKCEAELDKRYRFGALDVSCEGYNYPEDDYVLTGSCGLRYELDLVKAEGSSRSYSSSDYSDDEPSVFGWIVPLLVILLFCYIIWISFLGPMLRGDEQNAAPHYGQPSAPPPPPGFNVGDAPPPYSTRDENSEARYRSSRPNLYPDLGRSGYASGSNSNTHGGYSPFSGKTQTGSDSGAGFWTGLAAGGLGGFMMGRATAPQDSQRSQNTEPSYTHRRSSGDSSSGSASGSRSATGYATTSRR